MHVKLVWVSNVIACMQWWSIADDLFMVFNLYTPSTNIFTLSKLEIAKKINFKEIITKFNNFNITNYD